eukprot:scaffold44_cov339-Pavlova_lutheri.AAC.52
MGTYSCRMRSIVRPFVFCCRRRGQLWPPRRLLGDSRRGAGSCLQRIRSGNRAILGLPQQGRVL